MESLRKQKRHELNHHQLTLQNTETNTIKYTLARFNFLPDLSTTTHMNMRLTLGNTPPSAYFTPVTNLAFHNLTTGGILPLKANTLLGLGLKFIPAPKVNTSPAEQDKTLSRFERDLSLKVFLLETPTTMPPPPITHE